MSRPMEREHLDLIVGALRLAHDDRLLGKRRTFTGALRNVYASRRKDCVRAMALDALHPEEGSENIGLDAYERWEQGDEAEAAMIARLTVNAPHSAKYSTSLDVPLSYRVISQQERFEIKGRNGRTVISGKIDGRVFFETGWAPVFEIKSGRTFDRVETLEDLDVSIWTRHTLDQVLMYLLGKNEPGGLLIIRKAGRRPVILPVWLEDHLDRAEAFVHEAELACAAIDGGPLPDFSTDPALCRRCDHASKSCNPPCLSLGEGVLLSTDPEWEADITEMVSTAEAAKRHENLKKLNRERALATLGQRKEGDILVGKAVVSVSLRHYKSQPAKPATPARDVQIVETEIVDAEGGRG